MSLVCAQCNKWKAARDGLCSLCRSCLGVIQISKQERFTEGDLAFAQEQLNLLLGNLTARVVSSPPPVLGGETVRHRRREVSPRSSRGHASSPHKEGVPERPPPDRPRRSRRSRPESEVNIKALPASSEESRSEDRAVERREHHRVSVHRRETKAAPSPSRERSRRRSKRAPEDKEGPKTEDSPKEWKPTLHLEKRKGTPVPEPRVPPRAEASERSSRAVLAPAPALPSAHRNQEAVPPAERDTAEEENPPDQEGTPGGTSSSAKGSWGWYTPSKGQKGKGPGPKGKGKKGKGQFYWPPWGYWVEPQQWNKPKKKNRGQARVDWWAARKGKGTGKAETSAGKGNNPAPTDPPAEVAEATEAPGSGSAAAPAEDNRAASEQALREREESWANATEESEEARRPVGEAES